MTKQHTIYVAIAVAVVALATWKAFELKRDANLADYAATCRAQGLTPQQLPNGGIHCGSL